MPLHLQPDLAAMTREEVEAHLEQVRARRMVAAVTYFEGKNAKYQREGEKIKKKMLGKNEMLGKAIETLDRAIERVEKYLAEITSLDNELGLVNDLIVTFDTEKTEGE